MLRFFKYLSAFSSFFIFLIIGFVLLVIYTQWGFRTALVLAKQVLPELQYESVTGTISGGAEIDNLVYDADTKITVDKVHYEVERASIFEQLLRLSSLDLEGVNVYLAEAKEENPQEKDGTGFQGFESPVLLDLNNINIVDLNIYSADFDAETNNQPMQSIDRISGNVKLEKERLDLSQIDIRQVENFVKADGHLSLTASLPYDLDVQLGYKAGDVLLKSQGDILGSLEKVDVNQQLNIASPQFSGAAVLKGDIGLVDAIELNLNLDSDLFNVKLSEEQELLINQFAAKLTGTPEAYQLDSQCVLNGFVEQPSKLSLSAHGSTEEIYFDSIALQNQASKLSGNAHVNWAKDLMASSKLALKDFDVAMILPDYQSAIDGELQFSATLDEAGYVVTVPAFAFDGTVNEFPFEFDGQLDAKPDEIHIPAVNLAMGNNTLSSSLTLINQELDAKGKVQFNALQEVLPEASGKINGVFAIDGSIEQPNIILDLAGKSIAYQDIKVGAFTAKAKSDIETLDAKIHATAISASGNEIKQTSLNITGKPEQHSITWSADHSEAVVELLVEGAWNSEQQSWNGRLSENTIDVKSVKETLVLQSPMAIDAKIGQKQVLLSPACWKMKSGKADFCTEADIDYGANIHDVKLDVQQLDAILAKPYLPENIALKGQLVGKLDAQMNNNQWQADSQFKTINGFIKVDSDTLEKPVIDDSIEQFDIQLKGNQNQAEMLLDFKLDTENFASINLISDLPNKTGNTNLQGEILGKWSKPEVFAELTPEIAEAHGVFNLKGSIAGSIEDPELRLQLENPDGYFLPTRSGTKIEGLALSASAKDNQAKLELSALSGGGNLSVSSDIGYEIESLEKWKVSGKVQGDGFEFIDIPELKIYASPDLVIQADQSHLDIKGELIIPTATITVEQIPASATMPSNDIVIHQPEGAEEEKQDYQITYDVAVKLPDGIDLSVLDFEGVANGELRLRSSEEDQNSILAYGALAIENGVYVALGQRLSVNKSEVVFNGLITNPSLKIYATRESLDGRVLAGLQVAGTPDKLLIELYSSPDLPDAEILSYISTGRGLEDSDSAISNQQLLQMAILMGVDRAATAFPGLTSAAGIDRVRVNEANDSADSSVELGKNISEDVYLGYDYGLFNRLGFWVLEYQLTKALSLESRYGKSKSVDLNYNINVE